MRILGRRDAGVRVGAAVVVGSGVAAVVVIVGSGAEVVGVG